MSKPAQRAFLLATASVFVRVIAMFGAPFFNCNKRRRWGGSPSEYPVGHYFYSSQSSSVIKSKVTVTAHFRSPQNHACIKCMFRLSVWPMG